MVLLQTRVRQKDLKEVAKHEFDQMRFDPSAETFNNFLNKDKKVAKQAFGDRSGEITETFSFAKLPVQMQNELAITGKQTGIQLQTCMSNLWQRGTLGPRLILQEYGNIGIQERTIS